MTPIARGTPVRDTRRNDVGTARADSDPIAETVRVDWHGGGSSVVWVGRLVAAGEGGRG